jgi:hypothetical protein
MTVTRNEFLDCLPAVVLSGSRHCRHWGQVARCLSLAAATLAGGKWALVTDGDAGAARIAAEWADARRVPVREYPADWGGPCRAECGGHKRAALGDGSSSCPAAGRYRDLEIAARPGPITMMLRLPHLGQADYAVTWFGPPDPGTVLAARGILPVVFRHDDSTPRPCFLPAPGA